MQIGVDAATGRRKTKTVYGATETEVLGKIAALKMQSGKALDVSTHCGHIQPSVAGCPS